jgi:2-polyprenyl-3-methyl-5-hydroxy-6-metoxy-1,4-benzoquinol methylase
MSSIGCTNCAAAELRTVVVRRGLTVRRCGECGVAKGQLTNDPQDVPDARAIATSPDHFSFVTENYDSLVNENSVLLRNRMSTYDRVLGKSPATWLEVGPGSGAFGEALVRYGSYWLGVEIEPEMAKRSIGLGQNVIEANFSELTPSSLANPEMVDENGGFDVVYSTQVMEHVPNPEPFLRTALSVLRPGGIVHIDVPNHNGLTGTIRKMNKWSSGYGEIVPPHHMLAYDKTALTRLLKRNGFEVVDVSTYAYNHPTFGLAHARISQNKTHQRVWRLSGLLGLGGNLVALARKPSG